MPGLRHKEALTEVQTRIWASDQKSESFTLTVRFIQVFAFTQRGVLKLDWKSPGFLHIFINWQGALGKWEKKVKALAGLEL